MNLFTIMRHPSHTIEKLFAEAFGPWPAIYRRSSLCGWRPIFNFSRSLSTRLKPMDAPAKTRSATSSRGVTVNETREAYIIEVELPEMIKESLCLEISENTLMIKGEKQGHNHAKDQPGHSTCEHCEFERLIQLPVAARPGSIRARLNGNVVIIDITKDNTEPWN
jgi:HSP20 family molecular chaperone IbpA